MEPEASEDRPVSPKKKLRPSSTTNSEIQSSKSDSPTSPDAGDPMSDTSIPMRNGFGLAPTRAGRGAPPCSSSSGNANPFVEGGAEHGSQSSASNFDPSIQEEVVSSSESSVCSKKPTVSYCEGDADSLTNSEPEENSLSSEAAERKDL